MTTPTVVRRAIADTLAGALGGVTVYPTVAPTVVPPGVVVELVEWRPTSMARGTVEATYHVWVFASLPLADHAQETLDDLAGWGDGSVWSGLFDTPDGGVTGVRLTLDEVAEYGQVTVGEVPMLGARAVVRAHITR